MSDIKTKYPTSNSDTVAITFTSIASLANDSTNMVAGAESAAIDNSTNADLDHLVSGVIRAGTSPTSGNVIEIWAYAPISRASGTPTYPDVFDGTDSAETVTSLNVKYSALRLVSAITVDNTSNRDYFIAPTSIAALFGKMPTNWGLFVVNGSGVALNSSGHALSYLRIQAQTV